MIVCVRACVRVWVCVCVCVHVGMGKCLSARRPCRVGSASEHVFVA